MFNCKECAQKGDIKGRCCISKGHPADRRVSKRELEELKPTLVRNGKFERIEKLGANLYVIISKTSECVFLGKEGCVLREKPIGCIIFPFLPTKSGWIIRTKCAYWERITKKDLEKTIRKFLEFMRLEKKIRGKI
jgi:hypothetical protein